MSNTIYEVCETEKEIRFTADQIKELEMMVFETDCEAEQFIKEVNEYIYNKIKIVGR